MDEGNKEIKDKSICVKNYNLAKDFFKDNLSIKEKDKIFAHLLQCKNCLKSYKFYSKAVLNENFSVTEQAINFCNANLEVRLQTRSLLKKTKVKGLYTINNKYESIAKEFKLSKLKDVEAVSQLFLGDETIESIKNPELLLKFTKHLCYNICKEIDLLERCYRKGMGVLVENNTLKEEVITDERP